MIKGCVHIHIKDGEIKNIFCHLSDLPENGVIHLSPNKIMTDSEFRESHPHDKNELILNTNKKIYNLGSNSI